MDQKFAKTHLPAAPLAQFDEQLVSCRAILGREFFDDKGRSKMAELRLLQNGIADYILVGGSE